MSGRFLLIDAAANTLVIAQVEDKVSIVHSPQIAATPRLNADWIGPSDLSLSMRLPGQMDLPDVVAAIDKIADNVFASSDCAPCVLVDSPEQAEDLGNKGARILLFNSTSTLANGLQHQPSSSRSARSDQHTARRGCDGYPDCIEIDGVLAWLMAHLWHEASFGLHPRASATL